MEETRQKKLTARQEKFVDEYIKSGNATAAAKAAGYSERTARQQAAQMLRNDNVTAAIDLRLEEIKTASTIAAQEILEHLSAVVLGKVEDSVVIPSGRIIKFRVREADRLRACDMLLKIYGEYREKKEQQEDGITKYIRALEELWADKRQGNEATNAAEE